MLERLKKFDKKLFFQLLVVFIFPLLLCIAVCAFKKINFFTLYIPFSKDNDSLFCYKLVEGLLEPGGIKGYFGFNESHAQIGSFAAWNPLLVLPWVVFGRIFGWNEFSPILYNVVFFSISLTAFVAAAKLNIKQTICLLTVLALYPPLPLHLMNMLPEINLASFMLLYFAGIFAYINFKKSGFLAASLVCGIYLTICRPYYFLLFIVAIYYYAKSKIKLKWLWPIGAMVISVLAYIFTTKFFTAEYFEALFSYPYINFIKRGEIRWAVSLTCHMAWDVLLEIYGYTKSGLIWGGLPAVQYFIALLASVLLLIAAIGKKNKEKRAIYLGMGINYLCVFTAILILLRKANEGARHSFVFSLVALALLFTVELNIRSIVRHVCIYVVLIYLATKGTFYLRSYDLSNDCAVSKAEIESLKNTLSEADLIIDSDDKYDNTIIQVLTDYNGDSYLITDYHTLFAVPGGMGINICGYEYVLSNIDRLQSGYIAVAPGGNIDGLCTEREFTEVARTDHIVIYRVVYTE